MHPDGREPVCQHLPSTQPHPSLTRKLGGKMPEFDRFDIAEAWWLHGCDWGEYGIITRLHRMGFKPRPGLASRDDLEENGQAIYDSLPVVGPYDWDRRGLKHLEVTG